MATSKRPLRGKVALVTGASRGVGKGVALALGEAGATVYLTGRTLEAGQAPLPGTIAATAAEVSARGGNSVAVRCDHADDEQSRAVVARIQAEVGVLDVLVNNVFALPAGEIFDTPFWQQPLRIWDTMHTVGLRSHYVCAALCVPLMLHRPGALIANISSFGGAGYQINVAYGVGKAGVDRLARDMAVELKPHKITSVSLWPGIVRTERIEAMGDALPWDLSVSESPEFTGRAVVALAGDEAALRHTGKVLVVAELAQQYGFCDTDGSTPASLNELAKQRKTQARAGEAAAKETQKT